MSEESENARKHQYPPPKISPPGRSVNQPNSITSTTRANLISSAPRSRDKPRINTSVQRLDLSNEFTQPFLTPELLSQYSSTDLPPSNHVNGRYQKTPQPLPPSSWVPPPNLISPGTGSPYVPDSPTSSKYTPASMTEHTDRLADSNVQRQLTLPPDYRSTCSSPVDTHIPFAITNKPTRRDNQRTNHQLPSASASGSSLPSPQVQIAALSSSHESSLSFRHLPNVLNSNQSSSSSKRRSHEPHRASLSASLSGSPSTQAPTPNGTRQPPALASPNVLFPGSRSSRISPVSPIIHSPNQTNHPDTWSDEGALGLSDDYKRKGVPKVPPENFVFPPGRSAAHPEKSSKPKSPKNSIHSSKSNDDNSGRLRIISNFFKKKNKGRNTPPDRRILEESNYEFIVNHEGTRTLKSSYPLDPYNSVLLDNDRRTGELLSRLKRTGSPSFHDYATPPSSVLDLGCGEGHWVLEAAIAWEEYGTHVTGYDMVDISSNLLAWAAEGVRDNIQFVKGNFLKEELPFNNDTFDMVRMSCLALCITSDSWGFILREVCRVLVAGGRLEFIDDQIFLPYGEVSSPTEGYDDDGSDHDGDGAVLHDPKGKAKEQLKPSIVLTPEAWDRSLSISDLDALFERMLLDVFDIYKDPSDIILPLMTKIFGQAQEVETMNLVLAPPESKAGSGRSPQQGHSHFPGLILWPSTFIPMDHTEVEIHASKHLRTLLSCKNFLAQHAIKVAELEGERVDEEFVSQALWKYESFLRHRFNPPVPAFGSSVMPDKLTHVRTFRVFEAVKGKKTGLNL